MSELSNKVVTAKNALVSSIGENVQRYFDCLKTWFGGKWTKEEFDTECRKFLTAESVHLHNQFFIAMLNKIDALRRPPPATVASTSSTSRSSRKRKRSSRFGLERATFEPYDVYDFLPEDDTDLLRQTGSTEDNPPATPKYCVQEYFLPDIGFIMGRMMVGAWENGLVHVDDAVAEYMVVAVQALLKNIISAVILSRKQCKTTLDGGYFYDVGVTPPGPFVRSRASKHNTYDEKNLPDRASADKLPIEETFFAACEQLYPVKKSLISTKDLYLVLRNRNIIMSHTVHSINLERISQMLH